MPWSGCQIFAQHHSDLLFNLKLAAGGDALAYILVEHKSAPDPLVGLQLLRYMVRIWERWLGDDGGRANSLYEVDSRLRGSDEKRLKYKEFLRMRRYGLFN